MILLKILLWLLLFLLALILLLLVIPVGYRATGRYAKDVKEGQGQVSLFWGLIRLKVHTNDFQHIEFTLSVAGITFHIPTTSKKKSPEAQAKPVPKTKEAITTEPTQPHSNTDQKPPKKKPSLSFSEGLQRLRETLTGELMTVIRRFLKKVWNALRPETFKINIMYGLTDPYETALINNCLMTLFAVWPHQVLQLQPVFHDNLVDATVDIKGSLIPMAFLAAAVQLLLAKPVRRIWWPLVKKHVRIRRNTHVNEFK